MQTDHLISAKQLNRVKINSNNNNKREKKKKENLVICGLYCPGRLENKIKRKWKYQEPARELKKKMEYEGDGNTNCNWCAWNNPQKIGKGTGRLGNKWTQTPEEKHQLTLVWKSLKFVCTELYCLKHSYPILIIFKQIYLINWWEPNTF